jgi:hypothetical protein
MRERPTQGVDTLGPLTLSKGTKYTLGPSLTLSKGTNNTLGPLTLSKGTNNTLCPWTLSNGTTSRQNYLIKY